MPNPATIDDILNKDIFALLGLEQLTDEEKNDLISSMNDTIEARLLLSISEQLSHDEQQQMDQLNGEDLAKFLEERNIDIVQRLMEEAIQYRVEISTLFQMATTPPQALPQAA